MMNDCACMYVLTFIWWFLRAHFSICLFFFKFWTRLHQKSLRWCQQFTRIVKYPAIVISLLALTVGGPLFICNESQRYVMLQGISLLMVVINSLKLMFGFRSLPVYAQYIEVHTRHSLGIVGVIIESITIMWVLYIFNCPWEVVYNSHFFGFVRVTINLINQAFSLFMYFSWLSRTGIGSFLDYTAILCFFNCSSALAGPALFSTHVILDLSWHPMFSLIHRDIRHANW